MIIYDQRSNKFTEEERRAWKEQVARARKLVESLPEIVNKLEREASNSSRKENE